jgi:teichuronic acid biosynthesis glycosyltransferase TuaG
MNTLVSIITPMYNSEKFINSTIESVLIQTYSNWEMIIVDDCSTDNSVKIVEDFIKKDKRIKLIKLTKRSGPAIARNTAIREAQGRFIAFLDSDDLWKPLKLEKQIKFMLENGIAFSFTAYDIIDDSNKLISTVKVPEKVSFKDLLKDNPIGCLTAIYDTFKVGKIFMPIIEKRQDYGLWLKILQKVKYAYGLQESLAIYRIRRNSISRNKLKLIKYNYKVLREVAGLSLAKANMYLIIQILKKLYKTWKFKYF